MDMVKDKVALVTGAGSGIGQATALLLAQEGAKVIVTDLVEKTGLGTLKQIQDAGGEAVFTVMDIGDERSIEQGIQFAVKTYGRLDCAVNNAGKEQKGALFADIPTEEWDQVMDIDFKGNVLCMKYEIKAMLETGGGSIVNIASTAGVNALPTFGAYSSTKAGVIHATKCAAVDYAKAGIRVNCVPPGTILTSMLQRVIDANPAMMDALQAKTPMGRLGKPSELAEACVWLCSDRSSYVTGQVLSVDGGQTLP